MWFPFGDDGRIPVGPVPNRSKSSRANPWSPVFPRLLQNLEKCRPPYIPAFISEQGSDGRLCGTGT